MSFAFAAAGARVICTARRQTDIDAVAQEINHSHTSADAAATLAIGNQNPLGPNTTIDILVANAGMTRFNLFDHEPSPDLTDWWRVFETNVRGTVSFIRAVLPDMLAQKAGCIISLVSTSGSQDVPFNTAYAASKAAVIKFNQDLGVEIEGSGVTCFALHPGSVDTDLASGPGAVNMEAAAQSAKMQDVFQRFQGIEKQTVDLPANTCVALCVEEDAKRLLGGKYVDSQQDLGEVLEEARKGRVESERLYWLKMDEI
ncbi:MAG: hypothetical protein Q9169_008137 [Polycauliona sp. 2 TL-2023]